MADHMFIIESSQPSQQVGSVLTPRLCRFTDENTEARGSYLLQVTADEKRGSDANPSILTLKHLPKTAWREITRRIPSQLI